MGRVTYGDTDCDRDSRDESETGASFLRAVNVALCIEKFRSVLTRRQSARVARQGVDEGERLTAGGLVN